MSAVSCHGLSVMGDTTRYDVVCLDLVLIVQ